MAIPRRFSPFAFAAIFVHILVLSAVFDIYFVSPLQHGMTTYKAKGDAPASRVVLFVADGLRATSLYNAEMYKHAPYLNWIKTGHGTWGIAHTQVPTETRPGHIAMLAGFYEDPSAITKGWQSNPVDFDSVFNQSTNTWCWGSPDILNMFNKDNLSHIHLNSYDANMQDFSGKESPAILDTWVFERFREFLETKQTCGDLCMNGNIIFLHLLGLDTAGHSIKPTSEKYIENIKIVDKGIEDTVNLIDEYFEDGKTAYLFTSDHGMTDWGSHGDGSLHETQVPFIAWGAGLPHSLARNDLEQVDIAPLISLLIGNNIPINSVGVVPLHYLHVTEYQKAHMISANALQLSEQYITKHRSSKMNTLQLLFIPYPALPSESEFYDQIARLLSLLIDQEYRKAIIVSYELIHLFKHGLRYYYNYYQQVLLIFVTVGFLGWIVYLFSSITDLNTNVYVLSLLKGEQYPEVPRKPFFLFGLSLVIGLIPFFYALPIQYYLYSIFPIFTWLMVMKNYRLTLTNCFLLATYPQTHLILMGVGYLIGIQLMTFSFFNPRYLTLIFLYFTCHGCVKSTCDLLSVLWVFGQFALAVCPFILDLQTEFDYLLQLNAAGLWLCYGYGLWIKGIFKAESRVVISQFVILIIAFVNSLCVDVTIRYGIGLLLINQLISWAVLMVSFISPMLISVNLQSRVISVTIALLTPYALMAVGYENIFMFFFAQHLINWMSVEYKEMKEQYRYEPNLEHYLTISYRRGRTTEKTVRRCYYLLTFILISYFGVGNKASVSSFDPMWVRCFVTVFSPFMMTGLILIKLTIPFLLVMCIFRGIMTITKAQIQNTFLIILLFCDLMVLQFMYYIKNEGSWLEIGTSLSRFIIANVTTIILLILYEIASFLTTRDLRKTMYARLLGKYFGVYTSDII